MRGATILGDAVGYRIREGWCMQNQRHLGIVGVIVLIGLAVLPFARRAEPPETYERTAEPARAEIPLHVPAQIANSPATSLHDQDARPSEPPRLTVPSLSASRLEDNGLPPELPERYHPLVENPPSLSVAPRSLQRPLTPSDSPATSQAAPRTHKVKDGDTLAKLAQRYWGDAGLAEPLFEANRAVLSEPDPLPIGVVLQIPDKPLTLPKPKIVPSTNSAPSDLPAPVRQPTQVDALEILPLVPIR
jgi:LysM repeat protein